MEKLDSNKHSRCRVTFVNYGHKKFYNIESWSFAEIKSTTWSSKLVDGASQQFYQLASEFEKQV
jgi:hypothetical protein